MNQTRTTPLVSVIMAAHDAERTIGAAIESVLSQTYANLELVVVDDCSHDNTLGVVSRYDDSRIRIVPHRTNLGTAQTRYDGMANAKGEWIAVLDSDDVWEKDKLEKQFALQSETGASVLFTGSSFMRSDGTPLRWQLSVPPQIRYRKLLKQNLMSNSSVLVRKELYGRYAIVRDNIHEDFACWLNMLKDGYTAYAVREPLLVYRLSANSKSGNKLRSVHMNWNTYMAIGLSKMEAAYYMMWYMFNGTKKYLSLLIGGVKTSHD